MVDENHNSTAHARLATNAAKRAILRAAMGLLSLLAAAVWALMVTAPAHAQGEDALWLPLVRQDGASAAVTSPDGAISLRVYLTNVRAATGAPRFDVTYRSGANASGSSASEAEVAVVAGGTLGLDLKNVTSADADQYAAVMGSATQWRWLGASAKTVQNAYAMPIGERAVVPDVYGELTVELQSIGTNPPVRLQVIARAYNEGVALRYRLPEQESIGSIRIDAEYTTFAFTQNHGVWAQSSVPSDPKWGPHENEHLPSTLTTAPSPLENPITLQADTFYMALTEAAVENYPASRFVRVASSPPSLRVDLRGAAVGLLPFVSPWRVLMIAPTAAKLVEQNYLMYNLAPPSRVADTSWIKPGTVMRVVNVVNPDFAISVIDFAVDRGIKYVEFDAGWYGDENVPGHSPTIPLMNDEQFARVREHAADKGIGIVLYVNFTQLQREVDNIMGLYNSWGIAGLKLGFVDGLSQGGIKEVLYTVQKAAQYRMFVDIHDNYCPSGMNRTWPNLFTQECVRGNEHNPGAEHNATLPFTRLLLGPADYTIRWYSPIADATRTHQMALSILYFSPLKFLFWNDWPNLYQGEPEVDFFAHLPSRWDETRVLAAEVSDVVMMARRSGDEWFIGAITDGTARSLEIPLTFLAPGRSFTAHIFSDGGGVTVHAAQSTVTAADVLTIDLPATGGGAIRLVPLP